MTFTEFLNEPKGEDDNRASMIVTDQLTSIAASDLCLVPFQNLSASQCYTTSSRIAELETELNAERERYLELENQVRDLERTLRSIFLGGANDTN